MIDAPGGRVFILKAAGKASNLLCFVTNLFFLRPFTLALGCLLLGCGPGDRSALKTLSPQVGFARLELRANSTDFTTVDVYLPLDANQVPQQARPGLVYVQGGLVAVERYSWQAVALAERGYVVALPRSPGDLAIFSGENQPSVLEAMKNPGPGSVLSGAVNPNFIAVAGHSLGGVMAGRAALPRALPFQALIIQASFYDPADLAGATPPVKRLYAPTLYLAGQADCQAKLDTVTKSFSTVPSPAALVTLPGVTHYQFTNDAATDVKNKCAPTASLEVAHETIADASFRFLETVRLGRGLETAFEGLTPAEVTFR